MPWSGRTGQHLRALPLQVAAPGGQRTAAAAVAVTQEGLGPVVAAMRQPTHRSTLAALVLRRCAPHLGNHTGQWTLPGGRIDIWAAQSFWPAAWRPLPMYVATSLVWLGMALRSALRSALS